MNLTRTISSAALVIAASLTLAGAPPASGEPEATPTPLAIGSKAPLATVSMKGVDGKSRTIAATAGKKGTLVVFTCNHCPWVKKWQTRFTKIANAAPGRGVGVIAINANDPEPYPEDSFDGMKKRAREAGYKFPYVVDETSDVARAFGATRTPEAFLFDAEGKLVYHGAIDDNAQDEKAVTQHWLDDAVGAVASGKPVAVAETKAMGCGIKFRTKKTS